MLIKKTNPSYLKKRGLIAQICILVLVAIFLINGITATTQYIISKARIGENLSIRADEVSEEVISSIREYPAYTWLLWYWAGHAEEMEVEYDVDFAKGTATEEKCRLLTERHPDLQLRYCSEQELEALSGEDQRLYAEIVYSWVINRMNAIKDTFGCDYLYVVITDTDEGPDPYGTQFFLLSAGGLGLVRGTAYEQVYTLGVTVSVAENKAIQIAMRRAVEAYDSSGDRVISKYSFSRKLKDSGNYLDFYDCLERTEDKAVLTGSTYNAEALFAELRSSVRKDTGVAIIYQLVMLSLVIGFILFYMMRPLNGILNTIRFYTERKDSKAVEERLNDILTHRRSSVIRRNEIGQLAEDFIALTKEIDEYTEQIEKAATEKERLAFELETAAQIQKQMLPDGVPQFPGHPEVELCASMTPARSVGGDFYDYFFTDEHHLALVMADVSDKGIPAALFMAESKALIKSRAQSGEEPAKILTHVNNQLSETNGGNCFVTVWLAVIDLRTGKGVAANAGHEHPALCRKGEAFELVRYKHNIVIGMINNISYNQHTFQLNPGDLLYVYTDGVPEASNGAREQFGTDRMLEVLNRSNDRSPAELLAAVSTEIDTFMGEASRFDDTTMMCFYYKGNP